MTAEYQTFHTIGGESERVLTGVRGPTVYARDKPPLVNNGPEYTVHVDDVDSYRAQFSPSRAPELRPSGAAGANAPMETSAQHQLEHQFRGTVTIGGQSYTATMKLRSDEPEQPSGIGDIHCTIPAGEPLAKVLPAGGPLLGRCLSCGCDPEDQRLNPYGSCELCGHLGGGT